MRFTLPCMSRPDNPHPSLTPSYPLSPKESSRVAASAKSPEPHLGWYSRGYLPHWDHPGMIQSLNFRLADSLPQTVLEQWQQELGVKLKQQPLGAPASLPASSKTRAPKPAGKDAGAPSNIGTPSVQLRQRIEEYLDAGHGDCWLRRPDIAALVEGALLHFDPERYRLLAWCVMPNHVHTLIETQAGWPLAGILHSWKSFTGNKANALLGRDCEFWQREYLDRYVRNVEHYEKVLSYIEENPVKAGLAKIKTEWPWSSARVRHPGSAGLPAGESVSKTNTDVGTLCAPSSATDVGEGN